MVSDKDLGWLAGLFDGEGCITTRDGGKQLELHIANTEKALLEDAQAILDQLEIDNILKPRKRSSRTALKDKPVFDVHIYSFREIQKFFSKVPVHSKVKIARWNELRSTHFSPSRGHTKARQARLGRTYPSLM